MMMMIYADTMLIIWIIMWVHTMIVCRHCSDKYHYMWEIQQGKMNRMQCHITTKTHYLFHFSRLKHEMQDVSMYWLKKKLSYEKVINFFTFSCHNLIAYSLNLIQDFQSLKFYHDTSLSNSFFSFSDYFNISNHEPGTDYIEREITATSHHKRSVVCLCF